MVLTVRRTQGGLDYLERQLLGDPTSSGRHAEPAWWGKTPLGRGRGTPLSLCGYAERALRALPEMVRPAPRRSSIRGRLIARHAVARPPSNRNSPAARLAGHCGRRAGKQTPSPGPLRFLFSRQRFSTLSRPAPSQARLLSGLGCDPSSPGSCADDPALGMATVPRRRVFFDRRSPAKPNEGGYRHQVGQSPLFHTVQQQRLLAVAGIGHEARVGIHACKPSSTSCSAICPFV